jgi:superfamily II DNA or RNA helicase
MTRSVALRAWQADALTRFADARPTNFMAVACPGAGKTTFALAAVRQRLAGELRPIVVVVPTQHLKAQWAAAALAFGLHLDPDWSAASGRIAKDMHGIVVTYAQAASSAGVLRRLSTGGVVVLDEIHHAANERSWGDGVRVAFAECWCRLLLSGTPFRTDDSAIPFVEYSFGDYGDAMPDYEYGYGEALEEGGVVRPVFFPRFDGHMEWLNSEGEEMSGTFDDELVKGEWGARLRTALSVDGEWLATVIDHAHGRLTEIRETHPDAGGLVIATDHEHARGIANLLEKRWGVTARIALSDDPKASSVIDQFSTGTDQWIVAVRMISEGVDIPRLRVGVFATTTTTAMFFRQAVGRIARWSPGLRSQRAYMYLPDDPRLRTHAAGIAMQRRHSIEVRRRREEDGVGASLDDLSRPTRDEEQMSLFAALSSSVLTASPPTDGIDPNEDVLAGGGDLAGHLVDLPPPPPLAGVLAGTPDGLGAIRTRKQEKESLRTRNADRVRALVNLTGQPHASINSELNRLAGIARIIDATVPQLEKRLHKADAWLTKIS